MPLFLYHMKHEYQNTKFETNSNSKYLNSLGIILDLKFWI